MIGCRCGEAFQSFYSIKNNKKSCTGKSVNGNDTIFLLRNVVQFKTALAARRQLVLWFGSLKNKQPQSASRKVLMENAF